MSETWYGGWGLAELIALIQKYHWPAFAVALGAGLIVYSALHPDRVRGGDGGSSDLGGGDCPGGDAGSCGD